MTNTINERKFRYATASNVPPALVLVVREKGSVIKP